MKYIDAEKLKERIAKLEADSCISEYKDGFDDGVGCVLDIIDSLQQGQPEVDFEDIAYLLDNVKYMSGYWIKTNPNCAKIIRDFNKRLNTRKEE